MRNPPRIVATVEARMTSSRLPGKVLLHAGGKPLLQILLERLRRANTIDEIVVATTSNRTDDSIADLCKKMGIGCFRGSEMNVLDRVCRAASAYDADIIVEITGDCPLIDPVLVDDLVTQFIRSYPESLYLSNSGAMPWGFEVQVFTAEDLKSINDDAPDETECEHVSYRFYRPESGDRYRPRFVKYEAPLARPELRVTLDFPIDYELIRDAYEAISPHNPEFGAIEVINWLDENPRLRDAAIRIRNAP